MIRRALLLCLALAACGTAGEPPTGRGQARPSRVILYADTVTVEMSDRAFCTGPRTAPGKAWSGRLAGCPHLWPYQVQQPAFRFARLPLAAGEGGAGRASLTGPAGKTYVFSGPR